MIFIYLFLCRDLHIIPVHLSRPVSSSTHPRLALSRAEMVEQLIINHGISTDKQRYLRIYFIVSVKTHFYFAVV